MKKYILLLAVFSLLLFSCEVDKTELTNEANVVLPTTEIGPNRGAGFGVSPDPILTQSMAWASYVAAQVIYENPSIKTALATYLDGSKVLSMDDALGPNPVNQSFKNEFIRLFEGYVQGCHDPAQQGGCPGDNESPGQPVCPPCTGLGIGGEGEFLIYYLMNTNCTEFYFPRSIQATINNHVTSTSHPLTTFNSNEGNLRTSSGIGTLKVPFVNTSYVNSNFHTIIVMRPYRVAGNCDYSDYSPIDFTDFLDGPW